MFDFLENKINDIRRKPESVRTVYVWSMVGIVMCFVVFVWLFTLRENLALSVQGDKTKVFDSVSIPSVVPENAGKPSLNDSFVGEGDELGVSK
jgi:hypothetical protein